MKDLCYTKSVRTMGGTAVRRDAPHLFKNVDQSIRGMRIGLDREYALKGLDAGQAAAIEAALEVVRGLGAQVVDIRLPDLAGVRGASPQRRVHDADGSRRGAGDLCAVWLLVRRSAVQHSVHWTRSL